MISTFVRNAARIAMPFIAFLCLAPGCESDRTTPQPPRLVTQNDPPAWVAVEPTQCLTNPWEEDWLAQPGNDYADYPKNPSTPGLEPGEIAIITDYYQRGGVVVSDTSTAAKYEMVCAACSCPEGHTMFLRVRAEDVDTMLGFGYRLESPPGED